jgi:hypothetical protein
MDTFENESIIGYLAEVVLNQKTTTLDTPNFYSYALTIGTVRIRQGDLNGLHAGGARLWAWWYALEADGEIVCDAGVKVAGLLRERRWQKSPVAGESAKISR